MDENGDIIQQILNKTPQKFNLNLKKNFYAQYGIDFIIMLVIILLFLMAIIYFYVLNNIPNIMANWSVNRCNPKYMPYVNIINPDANKTAQEQISDNFNLCVKQSLIPVAEQSFKPVYYSLDVLTKSYDELAQSMTDIKGDFSKIRTDTSNIAGKINGQIKDRSIAQDQQNGIFKNTISKLNDGFTEIINTQQFIFQSFIDLIKPT